MATGFLYKVHEHVLDQCNQWKGHPSNDKEYNVHVITRFLNAGVTNVHDVHVDMMR